MRHSTARSRLSVLRLSAVLLLAAASSTAGCASTTPQTPGGGDGAGDGGAGGAAGGVSLVRDVFPIIDAAGCASLGCHDDPTRPSSHFTDLRTPSTIYRSWVDVFGFQHCVPGSDRGVDLPTIDMKRVVPGDPDASLVINKLTEPREMCTPFYGRMPPPPRPRLSADDIDVIRRWIAAGAPSN